MGAGMELRREYGPDDLHGLARCSKDANQSRRLLALAAVLDGHTRAEAAKITDQAWTIMSIGMRDCA